MVSPTARTRSAETTCTTTAWPSWRFQGNRISTFFQKTIALNDFYFGMDGFDFPMGNIQMVGKSVGEMYKGEKPLETKLAPLGLLNDIARHAVDFWLSTEDLPDPNNRVSVDRNGNITLSYTPNNQVPQQKLYDTAEIDAAAPGHASGPFDSTQCLSEDRHPDRGCGASGRHLPLRQRSEDARCSMSTAKLMSSTICMWSTPASSSASAR